MGSWNHTCAISNLHINAGKDVAVFLLLKKHDGTDDSFCYNNALYDVVPLPFYGKYDDYGGVEDCHGFGLPIILEELKGRLYKFGQGPNECHDCEVNPENLTIEKLFEADGEGRLGIQDPSRWNQDEYDYRELEKVRDDKGLTESQQFELDRLAAKIKKVDTFRQVTHVVIHGDIFKAILEKWYIQEYVGSENGNCGWNNSYVKVYFKDLVDSIPEYVQNRKSRKEQYIQEAKDAGDDIEKQNRLYRLLSKYDRAEWNSPNLAEKWMNHFDSSSSLMWALINVKEHVSDYIDANDWDGLTSFTKEVLTAAWINSFMTYTRKIWVKQCGQGSQNSEPLGYQILAQATLDILEEERKEYGEDEDYDPNQLELEFDE